MKRCITSAKRPCRNYVPVTKHLIARKLASFDAYHRSRLKRIELELASNTDERIRIMKTAERNRAESDYEGKRQAIESRRSADILSQRIAAGILEVSNE